MQPSVPGNVEAIEAWNTVLFDKFTRFKRVLTQGLGRHGERAMERHPPPVGGRVVDVGCGFGDTSVQLGERVGPEGQVVGVDAAARFIDAARLDAEAAGARNVRFEVADVEAAVPGGPYDLAFARFGTMFFNAPVIALRNVRQALRPGGALCMVVWRKKDANPVMHRAEEIVRGILGEPPKADNVTCGPGPFSMASADLVGDQLVAAGYRDIAFDRSDADLWIGADLDEALAFAMALGPAGEIVRLAGADAEARRVEIDRELRAGLADFVRPDGVWGASSAWCVTAKAP